MAKRSVVSINGYTLRKVVFGPGMEHESVHGELVHGGRVVAKFVDDGFGGGMHFTGVVDGHLDAVRRLFATVNVAASFISMGDFALELLVSILLNGTVGLKVAPKADRVALVVLEQPIGNGVRIRDLTLVPLEGTLGECALAQTLSEFREVHEVRPLNDLNFTV